MISKKSLSFIGLKKLSAADRMKMVKSPEIGRPLMSSLTPTQIAELFPKYFLRQLPDVGILVSQTARERQVAQEQFQKTVQSATVEKKEGGEGGVWTKIKKKFGFEPDTGKVHKPGEAPAQPAPTLSPEDLMTYNAIKSQPLGADDPKSKFLSTLTPEQLKAGGLEKVKDEQTGKEMYRYLPIQVSEEEIKSKMTAKQFAAPANASEMQKSIVREANTLGIKPSDLATMIHYESAGSMSPGKWGGAGGNYLGLIQFGPNERRKYGVHDGQSFDEQMVAVGRYLHDRGYKRWLDSHPNASEQEKRYALYSTINAGSPGEKYWSRSDKPGYNVMRHVNEMFNSGHSTYATNLMEGVTPVDDQRSYEITKKQIEEQKHTQRIGALAGATQATMGAPGAPGTFVPTGVSHGKAYLQSEQGFIYSADPGLRGSGGRSIEECASLSKAFVPQAGRAKTWKVYGAGDPNSIIPGRMVATNAYNDGSGGHRASEMGGSYYHTGIALTKPDKDGRFLILDQSRGRPATVRWTNINYHGQSLDGRFGRVQGQRNGFGAVAGAEMSSVEAMRMGREMVRKMAEKNPQEWGSALKQLDNNISTLEASQQPTAQANQAEISRIAPPEQREQIEQTVQEPAAVTPTITTPSTGAVPDFMQTPGEPAPAAPAQQPPAQQAPTQPEQQPQAAAPAAPDLGLDTASYNPEKDKKQVVTSASTEPRSYKLNQKELVASIRQTEEFKSQAGIFAGAVPDDTILNGFFADPRTKKIMEKTKTSYDPKTGKITSEKPDELLKSFGDMNTSKILIDTSPKPKVEPKKVEPPKPAPKIEASVTTAPPAQPTPAEPPTIKQFVKGEGYAGLKDVPNPKYVPPQQQAPTVAPTPAQPAPSAAPKAEYTPGTPAAKAWENRPKFGTQPETATAQPAPAVPSAPSQPATVSAPATPTAAPAPAPKTEEKPAVSVSVKPTGTPEQNKPAEPPKPAAPPAAPTATAEPKKEEPPKVPAKAEGGKVETGTGDISVYPIGGLRGDNAIAKDTNTAEPLFTMNTNRESVTPTGENGRANITPTAKDLNAAPVPQMNPMDALSAEIDNLRQQLATQGQPEGNQPAKPMQRTVTDRDPKMIDGLLDLTRQTFRNPTSERAFSRNNFQETGHAVTGGHYSLGNTTQA